MPAQADATCGFRLHPIDVAINKVLALAGRNEARDLVDVAILDQETLPLGALCWAAAGKDPGFTPLSLIELLKRRGRHRPEELARLHLIEPVDPRALKAWWLDALQRADAFARSRPVAEAGCLYYDTTTHTFVAPERGEEVGSGLRIVPHYGRPGGVLPSVG